MFIATWNPQILKAPAGRHVYSAGSKFSRWKDKQDKERSVQKLIRLGLRRWRKLSASRIKQMKWIARIFQSVFPLVCVSLWFGH